MRPSGASRESRARQSRVAFHATPGLSPISSAKQEALLVATACSAPPKGRARWTIDATGGAICRAYRTRGVVSRDRTTTARREGLEAVAEEDVVHPCRRRRVARMEDVLDLYAEPADPKRPCRLFDETPRQLIGETRVPREPKPGRRARYDYEYCRNGTANVFMFVDVNRPWRHAKVTDRHAHEDFAECMRDLNSGMCRTCRWNQSPSRRWTGTRGRSGTNCSRACSASSLSGTSSTT
jgi:hypothetical protein